MNKTMNVSSASIAARSVAQEAVVGDGLVVRRALPTRKLEAVGPFIFLDEMGPIRTPRHGVPAHPHAGIEVITYLFDGAIEHRDSAGHSGVVASGGASGSRRAAAYSTQNFPGPTSRQIFTVCSSGPSCRVRLRAASLHIRRLPRPACRSLTGREPACAFWPVRCLVSMTDKGQSFWLSLLCWRTSHYNPMRDCDFDVDDDHELGIYVIEGSVCVGHDPEPVRHSVLALLGRAGIVELREQ